MKLLLQMMDYDGPVEGCFGVLMLTPESIQWLRERRAKWAKLREVDDSVYSISFGAPFLQMFHEDGHTTELFKRSLLEADLKRLQENGWLKLRDEDVAFFHADEDRVDIALVTFRGAGYVIFEVSDEDGGDFESNPMRLEDFL